MTTELSFTDVTLTFPDGKDRVTAVNNVSFTLKPGELISITGPSGSGKSSLLALAATLITPDSGSIMLGDTELARLSGKQAAECRRNRIGIVFQQSNLIPSLTALEQLEMMRHLGPPWRQKTQRKKVRSRGMELLERLDLGDCADRRVGALSGGQRQRVNIARALMNSPELLVVDEPTSALDPELVGEVEKSIADAAKSGQTMILVSHDMSFVAQVADKVLFLDKGKIIESGTPDEIINHPKEERTKEFFASYKRTYI